MNTKKLTFNLCILTLISLLAASTVSALDYDPVDGIWTINQERNGKPGRGFQIEMQNNVIVLTFYGYEPDGEASWWLASGSFNAGSNQLTMDLGEYEGGMAFGDAAQDAILAGSGGKVTISFNSNSSGTICLPNEPCVAISKANFGYAAPVANLSGQWNGAAFSAFGCQSTLNVSLSVSNNNLTGTLSVVSSGGCASFSNAPIYGFVDGDKVVFGAVFEGLGSIAWEGEILGGNRLSGTWAWPAVSDVGDWNLQR